MKRITALILTCLLSVGLLCGCGAQQPEPALPEIIIGSDTYPPYVSLDDNGDPTGIDVEIATEAFRRMGYQAVFTTIDWEQKKILVDSGEIDCIWGCFSMSGREYDYQWAGPYAISRQVIAVDAGSDIYTMGDLAGKTIAVQSTGKPEVPPSPDRRYPGVRGHHQPGGPGRAVRRAGLRLCGRCCHP